VVFIFLVLSFFIDVYFVDGILVHVSWWAVCGSTPTGHQGTRNQGAIQEIHIIGKINTRQNTTTHNTSFYIILNYFKIVYVLN
jgi:hypothetical protein